MNKDTKEFCASRVAGKLPGAGGLAWRHQLALASTVGTCPVCVSSGLDLPVNDNDNRHDSRIRLQDRLNHEGYPEISDRWMAWFKQR